MSVDLDATTPRGSTVSASQQFSSVGEHPLERLPAFTNEAIVGGAQRVVLVAGDRVLRGYLRWKPRSVAMVRALRRLVEAVEGVEVEFR